MVLNDPTGAPLAPGALDSLILVVEDDPHFAELIKRILSPRFGFNHVSIAKCLAEARALMEDRAFHLIFLDLNLPDSHGLATLESIRARAEDAQILVMTGEADEELALHAMRRGAHDYLVKGHLSPDALRRVARYGVERYAATMALARSRLLLQSGLDALANALAVLDETGRILLVNTIWEKQGEGNPLLACAGAGETYAEGLSRITGACSASARLLAEALERVLSGGRGDFRVDYRLDHPAGESYFEASLIRFVSEGRVHLVVSHVDITERKRLEMQLRSTEELFCLISENVLDLMAIIDDSGRRLYSSPSYFTQLGYGMAEMQEMGSEDLLHPEDRPEVAQALHLLFRDGRSMGLSYRLRRSDGVYRVFESNGVVIPGLPDGRKRALVVARDVTERRDAERERAMIEVQLRQSQKLEAIGQLAAGIAHEINTPTQYIGDNIAFLREGLGTLFQLLGELQTDPEFGRLDAGWRERWAALDIPYLMDEFPQALRQSQEGVQRVTKIVSAMKDFSHPGGVAKEAVDLNRAIESTLTVSRNAWKYVAELQTDLDPGLPLVACFPGEFNQVILNLVVNAAHAIEEARAARSEPGLGRISVRTRKDGNWVEVRIEDSGTGIPEAIQSRVFDPFFTTKPVGRGTGQGLSIARSVIVEKHGGALTFETRPGQGTTFVLRMPIGAEP